MGNKHPPKVHMIRITELKLPLADVPFEQRRAANAPAETEADRQLPPHPIEALRRLAAQVLQLKPTEIAQVHVFKRSFDARKASLQVVYIVDVALTDPAQEEALLARWARHPHVLPSPDMNWQPPLLIPGDASAQGAGRVVVVGFGPCGMFAALALRIAARKRGLPLGSEPPERAATVSSRIMRLKTLARAWSILAFLRLVVAHFEWPDMVPLYLRSNGEKVV